MNIKKTKIVCTIGPASSSSEILEELVRSGMDVVRLNFSHGTHEERKKQIEIVRKLGEKYHKPLAVFADLQGPKLRLGEIDGTLTIQEGETIYLSKTPGAGRLPLQFDFSSYVKKGQRIYINDGLIHLVIQGVQGDVIEATAQNTGIISSFKGINIPDTVILDGVFTQKDHNDAIFALSQKVDFLALSFVQRVEDLSEAKKLIKQYNPQTKIIVKIEKKEAIENLEAILTESDAVMVARGDLAIETNAAIVPVLQQKIIRLARKLQKPVIVATHMLESMTQNPSPTRAEASDVGNAVLSQVDMVMLSAESASGKYPVEAVKFMHDTIHAVEENLSLKQIIPLAFEDFSSKDLNANAITEAAATVATRVNAKLIAVATATGKTARIISSFRPKQQIVAITHDISTRNQLVLSWGVHPIIITAGTNESAFLSHITETILTQEFAKKGDTIILIEGSSVGTPGGIDTIKVVTL